MKRRPVIIVVALGAMLALAALAAPGKSGLLVLDWATKAANPSPPVAILIEMGKKDTQSTSWSGRAKVQGAKVVHREGYSFLDNDKLVEPDAWEAMSHRPLRLPKGQAGAAKLEGMHHIGVVLQLADVKPDAVLELEPKDKQFERVSIPLKDVLAG